MNKKLKADSVWDGPAVLSALAPEARRMVATAKDPLGMAFLFVLVCRPVMSSTMV